VRNIAEIRERGISVSAEIVSLHGLSDTAWVRYSGNGSKNNDESKRVRGK
jgi:hypothetical protein